MNKSSSKVLLFTLTVLAAFSPSLAYEASHADDGENVNNELYAISNYIRASGNEIDKTKAYIAAVPKSNVILAYITGNNWCGSGGCTLLFISCNAGKYDVVHKETLVNLPISYMSRLRGAPSSISYWIRGGGVRMPYEVSVSTKTFQVTIPAVDKKNSSRKSDKTSLISQTTQARILPQ